jgi:serine/threonine-protein kinase
MDPSKPFSDSDLDDLDEVVRGAARAPSKTPKGGPGGAHARIGSVLLGKYRIEAVLGVGGMAVVYRATHRNGAVRAIKMLLPEYAANPEVCRRFRREGRCANAVRHPGAVSVIDDDVTEDGAAFLVLELLDGLSCDELSLRRGGRVSAEVACAIGLQGLDVLDAAHAAGVVHRDIKPGNLFVVLCGTVKVLDFGIARFRESVEAPTLATKTGYRLGTPAVMAPEQIAGNPDDLDGRADLWSLGATLYALTSGSLPARPARSLALAVPEMPAALVEVVDRALEFDPARRWPSAREMKAALDRAASRSFPAIPGPAVLAPLVTGARSDTEVPGPEMALAGISAGNVAPKIVAAIEPTRSGMVTIPPSPRTSLSPADRTSHSGAPALPPGRRRGASWSTWIVAAAGLFAVGLGVTARVYRTDAQAGFGAMPSAPSTQVAESAASSESPPSPDALVSAAGDAAAAPTKAVRIAGGALPRSCAQARAAGVSADGTVRIDPDGNGPVRAFDVFCADMSDGSAAPREYVTLANSAMSGHPEANATQFSWQGGACECPDLVRRFNRVRLDPIAMTIDPRDGTFATYDRPLTCETRHPNHCGDHVELAWGSPGSCRAPGDASSKASIDLRDTPFALAPTAKFVPAGFGAAGQATIAANRKTAVLTGGGQCGTLVPSDAMIAVVQKP